MVLTVDYRDGDALAWRLTDDGATVTRDADYTPTIYVTRDEGPVAVARERIANDTDAVATAVGRKRRGWRREPERVLRVDVRGIDRVRPLAARIRDLGDPGEYRLYDVDLSRGFRYCLDRGVEPTPAREPRTLELAVPERTLGDGPLSSIAVDGTEHAGDPGDLVARVATAIERRDPDVLVVNAGEAVPTLSRAAVATGVDLQLGRRPGWRRLAGESTYESYGTVHRSPARYTVPGRVVIDRANTFFYRQAGLAGCLDLVARSWQPLQELAWASIGRVLTAIQIRAARERGVLVPWHAYRPEFFKSATTLRDADRGGHILSPVVGVHDTVHELDFGSLYPNVIRTRNVSPETVRCDCHDRADVPGLGYSVCDERGYLPDVLAPLIDDRATLKAERDAAADPTPELDRRIEALKWVLVACFGYQGFANAKFGRIECHEAINAYAREILLDAKTTVEAAGWRVLHGVVDSLWVTPAPDVSAREREPLETVAARISDDVGILLEYEAEYDWFAFVPTRDSEAGALTRYFGRYADADSESTGADAFKTRGIECRQDSTPPFVADVQRDLLIVFDDTHTPEAVCDRLARHLRRLRAGEIDPLDLVIEQRASQGAEEYAQSTRTVAALKRAADAGLARRPGQHVRYVVVDDGADGRQRVRLASEDPADYDAEFYADLLVRATESLLSPLGWRRDDIEAALAERTDARLSAFGAD